MATSACCDADHSHSHSHGDHAQHRFAAPRRQILAPDDLAAFAASPARAAFLGFVEALNASVRNKPLPADGDDMLARSPAAARLVALLDTCERWVHEIPAATHKTRFGNPAFQAWFDRLDENKTALLEPFVPASAIPEVAAYLLHSWGNRKRIDYGTGHEAHFVAFLYCLAHLGVVQPDEYDVLVFCVFTKYISVMRTLQKTYWLEPAGSHGVWGLDDYHFLPFMFGSSQLYDHKYLKPKSIHNAEIIDEFSKQYIYFQCIQWVNKIKTASLRWHSPMLDDISGVKTWRKVNEGMLKMYSAEVLGKLPIMQHFLFGSILAFSTGKEVPGEDDEVFHVHALGQEFPTCCGHRIPSVFGEAKQKAPRRPLPFD